MGTHCLQTGRFLRGLLLYCGSFLFLTYPISSKASRGQVGVWVDPESGIVYTADTAADFAWIAQKQYISGQVVPLQAVRAFKKDGRSYRVFSNGDLVRLAENGELTDEVVQLGFRPWAQQTLSDQQAQYSDAAEPELDRKELREYRTSLIQKIRGPFRPDQFGQLRNRFGFIPPEQAGLDVTTIKREIQRCSRLLRDLWFRSSCDICATSQ